jgi:hypothetical protein
VPHTFAVLSTLPVTMYFPAAENATLKTVLECPLKVRTSVPVAAPQSIAVPSSFPVSA